jgi:hypothetical protein
MPFGRKSDAAGTSIDFDAVYEQLIAPAVRATGLEPVRADEDMTGGIVHKPMFERLILCEYAVARPAPIAMSARHKAGRRCPYVGF